MQDFSDVLKQIFDEDRSFFIDVSSIVKRDKDSDPDIPIFPNHHKDLDLTSSRGYGIIESKPDRR